MIYKEWPKHRLLKSDYIKLDGTKSIFLSYFNSLLKICIKQVTPDNTTTSMS